MSVTFYNGQGDGKKSNIDDKFLEKIRNMSDTFNVYNKNKFFELEFVNPKKNDLAFIKKDEKFNNTQSIYIFNNKWNLLLNCVNIDDVLRNLLQDDKISKDSTFSSSKIDNLLKRKVNLEDLAPVSKTNNYYSLNGRPRIPSKTSDLLKDDVFTKKEIENKLLALELLSKKIDAIKGKIKNNEKDELGFLENKIDNDTLILEDNLLKAIKIKNLELSGEELNKIKPLLSNVNKILKIINSENPLNNFTFKGTVLTKKELEEKTKKTGDMYVVLKDKDYNDKTTLYISTDKDFSYVCELNNSDLSRNFLTNPLKINDETEGILKENRIDDKIARKNQLDSKMDKVKNPIENNIAVFDSNGNVKDSKDSIENLAKKIHTHIADEIKINSELFEKNFDKDDTNLQKIINKIDTMEFNIDTSSFIKDDEKFGKKRTYSIDKILSLLNEKMNKDDAPNIENLETLKKISEDNNKLLFNNKKLEVDLSDFSTNDLKDYKDKRYMTDKDKNNLNKLQFFVEQQNSINQKLNNINQSIPSDVSGSNPLISDRELKNRFNNINFIDLKDVNKSILPNSLLGFDSRCNMFYYTDMKKSIEKIEDANNKSFQKVDKIKFDNLIGNIDKNQNLVLKQKKMQSKDLMDMPKEKIKNGILISNPYNNKYELKDVEEILFCQENFCKDISVNSWTKEKDDYITLVEHNLDSEHLIVNCYDSNKYNIDLKYQINNKKSVTLHSSKPIECKCIINCSQSGNSKPETIIASSGIIDDESVDYNTTYSSMKIRELTESLADKSEVYTKDQCENLFSKKAFEHSHKNNEVLNKLTEADNQLFFNGFPLLTKIKPLFYECHWNNQTNKNLDSVLDIKSIYNGKNYVSIMSSEFTIKNLIHYSNTEKINEEDYLRVVIKDNGMTILDTKLEPEECQKYELGISPNITVFVQGTFDGNYYITAL